MQSKGTNVGHCFPQRTHMRVETDAIPLNAMTFDQTRLHALNCGQAGHDIDLDHSRSRPQPGLFAQLDVLKIPVEIMADDNPYRRNDRGKRQPSPEKGFFSTKHRWLTKTQPMFRITIRSA